MNRKGFTLIELLVVISIIGILSAVALVSFQSVQKEARDAVRRSDLNQYRIALTKYALKRNGFNPVHSDKLEEATISAHMDWGSCTYWLMGNPCGAGVSISSCPSDPKNDATYFYRYLTNSTDTLTGCGDTATQWLLYADLESDGYWYICANGKTGQKSTEPVASDCW